MEEFIDDRFTFREIKVVENRTARATRAVHPICVHVFPSNISIRVFVSHPGFAS